MSNSSLEENVRRCTAIICDDSNSLWLADRLDDAVSHTQKKKADGDVRTITESEARAITQLENAFENSSLSPRYYADFIRLLRDGVDTSAVRFLRQHELYKSSRNRLPEGIPRVSDR